MKWGRHQLTVLRHGSCLSALQKEKTSAPGAFQRQSAKNPDRARPAIVAWDSEFYERLPLLFPHVMPAVGLPPAHNLPKKQRFAQFHAGGLSDRRLPLAGAGYRPMSGFDRQHVDDAFFTGST